MIEVTVQGRPECRELNARLEFTNSMFGSVAAFEISGMTTGEALAVMDGIRRVAARRTETTTDIIGAAIEAQRRSTPPQEQRAQLRWSTT